MNSKPESESGQPALPDFFALWKGSSQEMKPDIVMITAWEVMRSLQRGGDPDKYIKEKRKAETENAGQLGKIRRKSVLQIMKTHFHSPGTTQDFKELLRPTEIADGYLLCSYVPILFAWQMMSPETFPQLSKEQGHFDAFITQKFAQKALTKGDPTSIGRLNMMEKYDVQLQAGKTPGEIIKAFSKLEENQMMLLGFWIKYPQFDGHDMHWGWLISVDKANDMAVLIMDMEPFGHSSYHDFPCWAAEVSLSEVLKSCAASLGKPYDNPFLKMMRHDPNRQEAIVKNNVCIISFKTP